MHQLPLLLLLLTATFVVAQPPLNCFNETGLPCGECRAGCEQCGPAFEPGTVPMFHVRSNSCFINDPNAPFYDEMHGLYHLMWQEHVWMHQGGQGGGPTFGHAVSSDMVRWAHLPVAVWNDQTYDTKGIWTGSTTIVNGVPIIVYPGLCSTVNTSACVAHNNKTTLGNNFDIALPADHAGDPLLLQWVKPSYNPIAVNTGADPATAWRSAAGDWRLIGGAAVTHTSPDFVSWSTAGRLPNGNGGECPEVFPLPPPCSGVGCTPIPSAPFKPTHVWAFSHYNNSCADGCTNNKQDVYDFGILTDGPLNSTGNWTPAPEPPASIAGRIHDASGFGFFPMGRFYYFAAKSFWDSAADRRIMWGWASIGNSSQTLPRVAEYHAALNMLTFKPLPELIKFALITATLYCREHDAVTWFTSVVRQLGAIICWITE
jgi:beta-fructofuranosidase